MSTYKKFNVCCNHFNLDNHVVKNSLRLASINVQSKFNISSTDYLCTASRKKLNFSLNEEKEEEEEKDEEKEDETTSIRSSCDATSDNEEVEAIGELLDRTLSGKIFEIIFVLIN